MGQNDALSFSYIIFLLFLMELMALHALAGSGARVPLLSHPSQFVPQLLKSPPLPSSARWPLMFSNAGGEAIEYWMVGLRPGFKRLKRS